MITLAKGRIAVVLVFLIFLLIFVQFLPLASPSPRITISKSPIETQYSPNSLPPPTKNPAHPKWTFNPSLHANDYSLTPSQCSSAFPKLYQAIHRSRNHRLASHHNLSLADIDASATGEHWLRLAVFDNRVVVIADNPGSLRDRAIGVLGSLNRALAAARADGVNGSPSEPEKLPDIEVTVSLDDQAGAPHQWAFTRRLKTATETADKDTENGRTSNEGGDNVDLDTWIVPDTTFWAAPFSVLGEYEALRSHIRAVEPPWDQKRPALLWRGMPGLNPVRAALQSATKDKNWADVAAVDWRRNAAGTYDVAAPFAAAAVSARDQCGWQFLAHTEGKTYSARLRYLLQCASVVFVHRLQWAEYLGGLFVASGPLQNFVQVERDFSDLPAKVEDLLTHPLKAQSIVRHSTEVFRDRYLTPAATACYLRELVRSWAQVQGFVPRKWSGSGEVDSGTPVAGEKEKFLRGRPYEMYVLEAKV